MVIGNSFYIQRASAWGEGKGELGPYLLGTFSGVYGPPSAVAVAAERFPIPGLDFTYNSLLRLQDFFR